MLGLPIKWTIDSLKLINEKNDAVIAGGFAGSVIEAFGRVLLYPDGEGENKSKERFYKFIEEYLKECNPRYLIYKEPLWMFMRCDGAHSILAQYGVIFGGELKDQVKHLTVRSDIADSAGNPSNTRALFISTPEFMRDLIWSIEKFSYNLTQDILLQEKHRKVVEKLLHRGQQYINDNFPSDD